MVILLILSGIICIWLSLSCLRLRADIRYLHEQLGEIERPYRAGGVQPPAIPPGILPEAEPGAAGKGRKSQPI